MSAQRFVATTRWGKLECALANSTIYIRGDSALKFLRENHLGDIATEWSRSLFSNHMPDKVGVPVKGAPRWIAVHALRGEIAKHASRPLRAERVEFLKIALNGEPLYNFGGGAPVLDVDDYVDWRELYAEVGKHAARLKHHRD